MPYKKKQRIKQKILDALKDKAELSIEKGPILPQKSKLSRKDRKHSGRYTPRIVGKGKISEMIANAEEPGEEYDDWTNYRDGFRDVTKLERPSLFWNEEDREVARKRNQKIFLKWN